MKNSRTYAIPFRRKREGRTYYKNRIKMLLSNKYRFVIRKSLRNFQASIIKYSPEGDSIILTVNSKSLDKLGWKGDCGNLPSAYLVGFLAGKRAIGKGITDAILDLGFYNSTKGSRLYAALAGAIDSGLKIPFSEEILPPKDRISGEHISKYAMILKNDKSKYEKQFSKYLKNGIEPEHIAKHFDEIKVKING